MEAKNYTVLILGVAKTGMEAYVKRYLKGMMQTSRHDKGCLTYNIHQSNENPLEFMVYMAWKSKKDFEEHNKKPEMQEFRKKLSHELFDVQTPKTYWHLLD